MFPLLSTLSVSSSDAEKFRRRSHAKGKFTNGSEATALREDAGKTDSPALKVAV
jgi:hypothetical protein